MSRTSHTVSVSSRADDVVSVVVVSADKTRSVVVRMGRSPYSSAGLSDSWFSLKTVLDVLMVLSIGFCVPQSVYPTGYPVSTAVEHCSIRNNITEEHKTGLDCMGIQNIPAIYDEPVQVLMIKDSAMKKFTEESFDLYKNSLNDIIFINLSNLEVLESSTFKNLRGLKSLCISHANSLRELPSDIFRGLSKSFLVLRINKTNLKAIPDLSDLGTETPMHIIEFEGNRLNILRKNGIKTRAEQLFLEYNKIHVVENWAFNGSEIAILSLKGNYLNYLSEHSFDGIKNLRTLDLSHTVMKVLPTLGLKTLEFLRIENTPTMITIPPSHSFSNLRGAYLTYSFHCCSFRYPTKYDYSRYEFNKEDFQRTSNKCPRSKPNLVEKQSMDYGFNEEEILDNPVNTTGTQIITCGNMTPNPTNIDFKCWPEPDALNPCEDIMGNTWLRIAIWIVGAVTLLANCVVLLVVYSKKFNHSVPKFLMFNLAFADSITAIYLLQMGFADYESKGSYFNFSYKWQTGYGCNIAGFFAVFSSQLTITALSSLTLERWYSIRQALYTNKMTFRSTVVIMACGWTYAFTMAVMPLMGISSYSSTSICLPMDTNHFSGKLYVFALLTYATASFLFMLVCYVQIYTSLSKETRHAANGESRVSSKIVLLIGTNFMCTAPVIVLGYTALFGYPLIGVAHVNLVLVFIYPINSLANPFLYTILTRSFKSDVRSAMVRFGLMKDNTRNYKVIYSTQQHSNNTQRLTPTHRHTVTLMLQQPA